MGLGTIAKTKICARDGWRCRHCQDRSNLTVHHVVYKSHQGSDLPNNLITLCLQCHEAIHRRNLVLEVIELLDRDLVVRFIRKGGWKPK